MISQKEFSNFFFAIHKFTYFFFLFIYLEFVSIFILKLISNMAKKGFV